jgi:hypothetical protein
MNKISNMKKLITSALFLVCACMSIAQTTTDDYFTPSKPKLISKDRVFTSISAGASVSFLNSSKTSAFTTFIAPKIGYQLTTKFRLNVGLLHYSIAGNTMMPLNQQETLFNTNNKTISGNLLFVEGQYQLNKRLLVSGAILYNANSFTLNKKNNYKAATVGLEYKVTKHSSIKFETTVSQGQSNYYNNSFPGSTSNYFGNGFSNGMNNSVFR